MAEYFLPIVSNIIPQNGVTTKAPMLVRLPNKDISIIVIGAARTVSLDTKLAIVYDGRAYTKPVRLVKNETAGINRI
jgi:hypothetical protein